MRTSEQIDKIAVAVVKAQAVMPLVEKTGDNPYFDSAYATLGAVMATVQKPLSDNGLCIVQGAESDGAGVPLVTTRLQHDSGQFYETEIRGKDVAATPQAFGSAITYFRRYAVMAILGLAPEDDDAEQAMRRQNNKANKDRDAARREGGPRKADSAPAAPKDTWIPFFKLKDDVKEMAKAQEWKTEDRNKRTGPGTYKVVLVPAALVSVACKEEGAKPASSTPASSSSPAAQPTTAPAPAAPAAAPAAAKPYPVPRADAPDPAEKGTDATCWCGDPRSAHNAKGECQVPGCGCAAFDTLSGPPPVHSKDPAPGPAAASPGEYKAAKNFEELIKGATKPATLASLELGIKNSDKLGAAAKATLQTMIEAKKGTLTHAS